MSRALVLFFITMSSAFASESTSGQAARLDINGVVFNGRETSWRGVNLETRCGAILKNDREAHSTLIAISDSRSEGQWLVTDADTEVTPGLEHDPKSGIVVLRDLTQGKYLRIENRIVYGRRSLLFSIHSESSWKVECEIINPFGPFNPLGNPFGSL